MVRLLKDDVHGVSKSRMLPRCSFPFQILAVVDLNEWNSKKGHYQNGIIQSFSRESRVWTKSERSERVRHASVWSQIIDNLSLKTYHERNFILNIVHLEDLIPNYLLNQGRKLWAHFPAKQHIKVLNPSLKQHQSINYIIFRILPAKPKKWGQMVDNWMAPDEAIRSSWTFCLNGAGISIPRISLAVIYCLD